MYIKNARNKHSLIRMDGGEEFVKFITGGKNKLEVLVDVHTWKNYLYKYHWTGLKKGKNYWEVKTSVDKHSVRISRMIVENEYDELDYWGNTIDHINNNPLDNRLENLRVYNSKLNSTNIKSKFSDSGMNLIHAQARMKNGKRFIYGYKIHTNVFDETIYKHFSTIEEAKEYRDDVVLPFIKQKIEELKKKTRDIEFERGLRDKLNSNEIEEVKEILKKYGML